jgi:hypothetical protein
MEIHFYHTSTIFGIVFNKQKLVFNLHVNRIQVAQITVHFRAFVEIVMYIPALLKFI